jgi:hypothetical protein
MNSGHDPDDWFDGTEPERRGAPDREADGEDWLLDDDREPPRPWLETINRRIVVLAVVGVALFIAVLAAAGVFSSSPGTSVPPITSTPTSSTSITQPTTTAATPPVPAPTATLKPGDTGAQVKVLQRALASIGFSTGKIDGQYGPATQTAVKRFQRSAGLKADGIAGSATVTALATALRGA